MFHIRNNRSHEVQKHCSNHNHFLFTRNNLLITGNNVSSSSSSAFNVRGPHITQAWDVRHPRWHGSDGCPQQHSVVSCANSTNFNGSRYTRLCHGSSMNSWLTWGYWYMFLLLKELLPPDGLPARTHPLGRGVFNETPSRILYSILYWIYNSHSATLSSKINCRVLPALIFRS